MSSKNNSSNQGKDPLFARDGYASYPEEFPMYPTHEEFPASYQLSQEFPSPLGVLMRPFIYNNVNNMKKKENELGKELAEIARCSDCGAYINPYCDINTLRWYCAICNKRNTYSKAYVRYRHIDPKLVPELKNALVDIDVPFQNKNCYELPVSKRPLIHMLLIHENMQLDTIEMAIDSIRKSLPHVHDDIYFLLLTYSNERIALHSLKGDSPIVQFDHFLRYDSEECIDIPIEADIDDGFCMGSEETAGAVPQPEVSLMCPLSEIEGFEDCPVRLGDSRKILNRSLSSVLNRQSIQTVPVQNGTLLLTLHAIKKWILTKSRTVSSVKPSDSMPSTASSTTTGVFDFSRMLDVVTNYFDMKPTRYQSPSKGMKLTSSSGEQSYQYSGIILHIFADNLRMHFSTHDQYVSFHHQVTRLAKQFLQLSVSINMYAVCSFENDQCDLSSWRCLSQYTGGQLHRVTLGLKIQDSKEYFTELLRRIFTQAYATRCQLKLRTSSTLCYHYEQDVGGCLYTKISGEEEEDTGRFPSEKVGNASLSLYQELQGSFGRDGREISTMTRSLSLSQDDYELRKSTITHSASTEKNEWLPIDTPGIYSIPVMTEDSCYGFRVHYLDPQTIHPMSEDFDSVYYQKQARQMKKFQFFQLAFSYETLIAVEGEEEFVDLPPSTNTASSEKTMTSSERISTIQDIMRDHQYLVNPDELESEETTSSGKIQYLQYLCEQLQISLSSEEFLMLNDEYTALLQWIESESLPVTTEGGTSMKSRLKKRILQYLNHRRKIEAYSATSRLKVVKKLRVITYAMECTEDKQRLNGTNYILPNVFALLMKVHQSRMIEEEIKWRQKWWEYSLTEHKQSLSTTANSGRTDVEVDDNSHFYDRRHQLLTNPQTKSEDQEILQILSTYQTNEFQQSQLLNELLPIIDSQISYYHHQLSYAQYSKEQLLEEIFAEVNQTNQIALFYLHHLIYLIYIYITISQRYNNNAISSYLPSTTSTTNASKDQNLLYPYYHYSDEYVSFWWKLQYYQSMMIYRLFIPNFMALEEEFPPVKESDLKGKESIAAVEVKDKGNNTNTKSEGEQVTSDSVLLNPSPSTPVNPLLKSEPLHKIVLEEDIEDSPPQPGPNQLQAPSFLPYPPPPSTPPPSSSLPSSLPKLHSETQITPKVEQQIMNPPSRINFTIKSQFLSLRRENTIMSGCSYHLLDGVQQLIFYEALVGTHSQPLVDDPDNHEATTTGEKKGILPYLVHRCYEHPILPRFIHSQAGTATALHFLEYFFDEYMTTEVTFSQFKQVLQTLLTKD